MDVHASVTEGDYVVSVVVVYGTVVRPLSLPLICASHA